MAPRSPLVDPAFDGDLAGVKRLPKARAHLESVVMTLFMALAAGCFGGADCRFVGCAPGLVCVALRGGCQQECPRVCAAPCELKSQCGAACSCSPDAFGQTFCATDTFTTNVVTRGDGGRVEFTTLSQDDCF